MIKKNMKIVILSKLYLMLNVYKKVLILNTVILLFFLILDILFSNLHKILVDV